MTEFIVDSSTRRLKEIRAKLGEAIIQNAIEAQGSHQDKIRLIWEPIFSSFGYKKYRSHEYAILESTDSQVVAHYVNGVIYITHNGFERSRLSSLQIGLGTWSYTKYPDL